MATLADINNTLLTTQKATIESGTKIEALAQMWADYTFDYRRKMNDEALQRLEEEREAKKMQTAQKAVANNKRQDSGSGNGLLDSMGMGSLAALGPKGALTLATSLLKRGALGAAAVLFADEIANAIPGLQDNPELKKGVEAALVGGGAGFALAGVKGGLAGAVIGAGFQLSDLVGEELAKQAKNLDLDAVNIAEQGGKSATQALSLAVGGAMIAGPIGGLIGAIAGLGIEGARLYDEYKTNPAFRAEVDGAIAATGSAVAQIFKDVQDAANNIPGIDSLITTEKEREKALALMAEVYPNMAKTAARQEEIMRDYQAVGSDIEKVNEKYNLGLGANATNIELRQAMKAKGIDVDTAALYQKTYREALNAADIDEFKEKIGYVADETAKAAVRTIEKLSDQEAYLAAELAAERTSLRNIKALEKDSPGMFGAETISAQEKRISELSKELNQLRLERGKAPIVAPTVDASTKVNSAPQAIVGGPGVGSTHNAYLSEVMK